jgi:hypothetical protein
MNIPINNGILPAVMPFITLEEMQGVRLMNRTDRKYVASAALFPQLMAAVAPFFSVQVSDGGKWAIPYSTQYFDTPELSMYTMHQNGKLNRQKIRIRSYVDAGVSFLEVKNKNNRGRTSKSRVPVAFPRVHAIEELPEEERRFLTEHTAFEVAALRPSLSNRFDRITLVNNRVAERVTIDLNLSFRNHHTGCERQVDDLMVVELKQSGRQPSTFRDALCGLRIKPHPFSKYCMGSVLTNPSLKYNRFKNKWIFINKIIHRPDDAFRL